MNVVVVAQHTRYARNNIELNLWAAVSACATPGFQLVVTRVSFAPLIKCKEVVRALVDVSMQE